MNLSGEKWWSNAIQRKRGYYDNLYRELRFNVREPVLEIGGGAGTFLKYNKIENATIVDMAGRESLVGNYDFIEADITKKLPAFENKFKTIFIMEVLEHIKNPLYLAAQVYDLLDDNGIFYVSVPYTKLDINRNKQKNPLNCHVCRWKINELTDQMRKLGFNVSVIQKRRRFKNTAFYLPHCWLVLKMTKRLKH
jgi:SAM-dependent methyltransferase